jgi:hypothetical protein
MTLEMECQNGAFKPRGRVGPWVSYLLAAIPAVLLGASPAWASCDAANTFSFAFSSQTAATLAYGSTYTYTATSGGGANKSFTVQVTQNGLTSTQVAGNQMPNISTMVTGSTTTANDLVLGGVFGGRTTTLAGTTRTINAVFTFATPIRDFSMTVNDVDFTSNQYRDWVQVTGTDGTNTYTPVLTTPYGNGNDGILPHTATNSTVTIGTTASPLSLTSAQAAGNATSGNNADNGNLTARFPQPVTSVTFRYGNYPLTGTETTTGQQAMGISGVSFCPMPAITASKTEAPAVGTYGAFNIPGNDVVYTLTVTNAGGSPVDASSLNLADALPANVTFRNSAFDGTTTLPIKVVSAGGTTLSNANIAYSKVGDSTWTYTPSAGYDAQVDGIQIVPGGALAANSTLTVQFIARVN